MSVNKKMITAQDLAEELDLSVDTIWRYTREKKIPFIDLGNRQYRYKLEEVIKSLAGSRIRETGIENKNDSEGFTYQDYLKIPEEAGYQFEVLEGTLIKEPSPNVLHQRVSRRLQRILEDYLWEVDPEGEVFSAPLDVTLSDNNVVQPDLFYIASTQKTIINEKRIDGAPVLAIEIISPYNTRKDRLLKMRIYQKSGIENYWLVDPAEKIMECFALRDGIYALLASGMDEDVLEHPDFKGLSIELGKLW